MTLRAVFLASFIAAVHGRALAAQTIRGTIVDSSTSQPISDATVELVRSDSQVVARESSDKNGRFRLRAKAPGPHHLLARRIGYRTSGLGPVVLQASGDTIIDLRLAAVPVELAPVAVTGEVEPYLQTRGFYERKLAGVGTFLDPPAVEKLIPKAKVAADIFAHIPGVSIIYGNRTSVRVPQLRSCRTISQRLALGRTPGQVSSYPSADTAASDLSQFPRMYVDGLAVGYETFGSLLPADLLAVEVYMGPAQVPLQYGGTDAPCGVILIWSKH